MDCESLGLSLELYSPLCIFVVPATAQSTIRQMLIVRLESPEVSVYSYLFQLMIKRCGGKGAFPDPIPGSDAQKPHSGAGVVCYLLGRVSLLADY